MTTVVKDGGWNAGELGSAIQAVVSRLPGPLSRVMVQLDGATIEVEWHAAGEPAVAVVATPVGEPVDRVDEGRSAIVADLVGTFYGRPSPDAAPFVEVGDLVEGGQQVGIIETMKLFTPVVADRAGRIAAFNVKDGEMVEFGQPLLDLVTES
ncbi:acetyl-CoA carboxylase [Micromonospora sp. CPCC 205711]|uniref:acetyl-CoA carboxylase n=1 Tax=Micromonospora sp. CPCC 205547 TaxID=3122400 RepID=UPI002FF07877